MAPRKRPLKSSLGEGYKVCGRELVYFTSKVRNEKDSHDDLLKNGAGQCRYPIGANSSRAERLAIRRERRDWMWHRVQSPHRL